MKLVIEGHTVVVNKMSIYIDGNMEFQAVNMITEYGQKLNGCMYAVASRYSRKRLEELYTENLKKFSPFIYLTEEEYQPIRESNNNNSKFHQREINYHAGYEYEEELTEAMHEVEMLCADPEPDALTQIIEREDAIQRAKYIAALPVALASLTEKQRERTIMYFYDNKSFREIAEIEEVDVRAVWQSIEAAMRKMENNLKKF